MKRIALIPARGGSKRLPRKNVIEFEGHPIISYSITAAYDSGLFDRVVVSTEDTEIAEVARQFNAEVDIRDASLATDSATVSQVCADFLLRERQLGNDFDVLACLYATAPLRNVQDVVATISLVEPGVCDYAMAVSHYDLPPHQAMKITETQVAVPMWPELFDLRESEVGELLVDNGSTYGVAVDAFLQSGQFIGPGLKVHVMPRRRSIDIDLPDDLQLARYYARLTQ